MMAGIHLFGLELSPPAVKVGDFLLQHPALILDAFLIVGNVLAEDLFNFFLLLSRCF
jgi:hypothetical protein